MHFIKRETPWIRAVQFVLTAFLVVGLMAFATGCGGAGANEDDGEDGEDGEDTTAPAAPSGLTADAEEAAVGLSWSSVDGADTYSVYRSTSSTSGASGSALHTGISQTNYTDETAENGTTYYYRVTAVGPDGNESDGSGEVQSTPFTNPTGLSGTSGDSQVSLSWDEAAGGETYSVYRATSSFDDVSGMAPLAEGISSSSYTDDAAENGTKYHYRVTTVNPEEEESGASGEITKTPFAEPDRP